MSAAQRSYAVGPYAHDDPWHFALSAYEKRKYALTVASLPKAKYRNAFEPGCSIGILSEHLARRCQRLLAADIDADVLDRAAQRVKGFPHVRIEQRTIPTQWPDGLFDLVVFSELAYYFDEVTLNRVMALVIRSTVVGAHILGVHGRGEADHPLTADRTHEVIASAKRLHSVVHHEETQFVLDVWERVR